MLQVLQMLLLKKRKNVRLRTGVYLLYLPREFREGHMPDATGEILAAAGLQGCRAAGLQGCRAAGLGGATKHANQTPCLNICLLNVLRSMLDACARVQENALTCRLRHA